MTRTVTFLAILCVASVTHAQSQVFWEPAQCGPSGCGPQYQQPQYGQPQRPPVQPQGNLPQFEVRPDPPLVPVEPGDNPSEYQADIETLKADNQALLVRIQKLELQIVNLATMPGQVEKGDKGDKGDQGLTGEAGQSPVIDINQIAIAVGANLNYQELAGGIQPFLDPFSIRAYRDDPYQKVFPGNKVDLNLERQ